MVYRLNSKEETFDNINSSINSPSEKNAGGYDGMYASGFADANIAAEIRNVSSDMGQSLLKIAEEDGMKLVQSEGYFIFGAGKVVKTHDFSICIPTSFIYEENVYNQKLIAFSSDATVETLNKSPIEIWVEYVPLLKKQLTCEFFQIQLAQANLTKRSYKELEVGGKTAILTMEYNNGVFQAIARIAVLLDSGTGIYNLKIIFNSRFDNIDSIVSRIYAGIKFRE